MAIPPLEHQITFVDSIVLAKAEKDLDGKFNYIIEEVLKSRHQTLRESTRLNADLTIFQLLGYSIHEGQRAFVFLAEKNGSFDCIDFLPVVNGVIEYGVNDSSVRKVLTVAEFRELVRGIVTR